MSCAILLCDTPPENELSANCDAVRKRFQYKIMQKNLVEKTVVYKSELLFNDKKGQKCRHNSFVKCWRPLWENYCQRGGGGECTVAPCRQTHSCVVGRLNETPPFLQLLRDGLRFM